MEPLADHTYLFALGQKVEAAEGMGWVTERYPSGAYVVTINNKQCWKHECELAAVEETGAVVAA